MLFMDGSLEPIGPMIINSSPVELQVKVALAVRPSVVGYFRARPPRSQARQHEAAPLAPQLLRRASRPPPKL